VFLNLTYSNSSLGHYWFERWELYKLFYSQTLWMYQRNVTCVACSSQTGCADASNLADLTRSVPVLQAAWRHKHIAISSPYDHEVFRQNEQMHSLEVWRSLPQSVLRCSTKAASCTNATPAVQSVRGCSVYM